MTTTASESNTPVLATPEFEAPAERSRSNPGLRVIVLCLVLLGGFIASARVVSGQSFSYRATPMPWWVFTIAFAVTALAVVNIEVHREVHMFTFMELPLSIALFVASPMALIVGRAIGELIVLLWRVRSPQKILFNLSLYACESGVALCVFRSLTHNADIQRPTAWAAAVAAVLVADSIGWLSVSTVIRWHGGGRESIATLLIGVGTAIANTSFALAAALLLSHSIASVCLLGALGGVLFVAYRGYSSLSQRYSSLQLLYDFSRAISGAKRAEMVLGAILEQAQRALRCEVAEIVLLNADEHDHCFKMRSDRDLGTESSIVDPDAPFWDRVVDRREVVLLPRSTKRANRNELLQAIEANDAVIAPLFAAEGVAGYLLAANRMGEVSTFDGSDARLL